MSVRLSILLSVCPSIRLYVYLYLLGQSLARASEPRLDVSCIICFGADPRQVAKALKETSFPPGETVIAQGEVGKATS